MLRNTRDFLSASPELARKRDFCLARTCLSCCWSFSPLDLILPAPKIPHIHPSVSRVANPAVFVILQLPVLPAGCGQWWLRFLAPEGSPVGTVLGLTPLRAGKCCSSSSPGSRERAPCSGQLGGAGAAILGMGWGIGAFAAGGIWDLGREAAAPLCSPEGAGADFFSLLQPQ